MTQHPFDREHSEQEAQKLNSESVTPANEDELTDEEAESVSGGDIIIEKSCSDKSKFAGIKIPPNMTITNAYGAGENGF